MQLILEIPSTNDPTEKCFVCHISSKTMKVQPNKFNEWFGHIVLQQTFYDLAVCLATNELVIRQGLSRELALE